MWIELALLCLLPCVTVGLWLGMAGYGLWVTVTRRGYFDEV